MQPPVRPLGPRQIRPPRSASPIPPLLPHSPSPIPSPSPDISDTISIQGTEPLNVRRKPNSNTVVAQAPTPPASSPPKLIIPTPPVRSTTPRPKVQVLIPVNGNGDSNFSESNYGLGPRGAAPMSSEAPEEITIRPMSAPSAADSSIPEIIERIRHVALDDEEHQEPSFSDAWSDEALEEVAPIGEGAGGAVHKVKDKRTGRIMARKTITTRAAPMKQLERELSIMYNTKHPNIIRFYGAYMSPSSSEVKILMEFGEGGSLEAVGKRIKEKEAIVGERIAGRIAEGVLQGLNYLHSKRTIHRDIKPSNILLSREGVVKLCDFGVSGELVESHAGTFTGTSFYMAPERISGEEYTIRSDVWSTGISLLELVQNRFPFPNDVPPIELMMYITSQAPPQLEDEGGVQWSDEMKDFIRQTLTHDGTSRPYPRDMLKHPWIERVMKQEVHMARWIREVWGWKRARTREEASRPGSSSSRPSSSHRQSFDSPP